MKKAIEDSGYQYLGLSGEVSEETGKESTGKRPARQTPAVLNRVCREYSAHDCHVDTSPHIHADPRVCDAGYIHSVFVFVSYPIFRAAHMALRNRSLNMDVMYAMGIGVAFVSSVMGTFGIVLTTEFMFYDTAIMLASFLMLGRYLETRAKGRTSDAIKKLAGLQPKTAIVLRNGKEEEIPVEDVVVGDIVVIKPGEQGAGRREVVGGESYVDEAMITGEPVPPLKTKGSRVVGGTINQNSVLSVKALKVGKETVLAQIIQLVEDAQGSKPAVQRIADTAVTYFIPAVLGIAAIAFIVWYFVTQCHAPLCPHCSHLRPRGCLSLCARTCNTDCSHRRGRAGCRTGDPDQEW